MEQAFLKIELDPKSQYCVVMPAFNAEGFIASALSSVARQECKAREVIVVDDGSTDGTAAIATTMGATVFQHRISNGPGAARNAGVAATCAPLIAFLDADDEWSVDHVARLLPLFANPGVCFAASQAEMFGVLDGQLIYEGERDIAWDARDDLIRRNPITQSAAMVSRSGFQQVGGYDTSYRLCEDYDLWQRLAPLGLFALDRAFTARYRVHSGQTSHRNAIELVELAWKARRSAVRSRAVSASASEMHHIRDLVDAAARDEMRDAVRSGSRRVLEIIRAQWTGARADLVGGAVAARNLTIRDRFLSAYQDVACEVRGAIRRARYPGHTAEKVKN